MFTSTLKRRFRLARRASKGYIRRRRSVSLSGEWLEDRAIPSVNLGFAFGLGSVGGDVGERIVTDRFDNIYVAGSFSGTVDFDPGPGAFNLVSSGNWPGDNFVAKYSNNGALLWAKDLGVSYGNGRVATDTIGNVYVAQLTGLEGPSDSASYAISKLDGNGNLIWSDQVGSWAAFGGLAVDAGGNLYTTGFFQGTVDFDPGTGTYLLTSSAAFGSGNFDIFVSKLDTNGNFVWARDIGGKNGGGMGKGIAVDVTGNLYTTGWFGGTVDFDPGPGTFNLGSPGFANAFVCKLDSNGNFIWAKQLGRGSEARGSGLALDGSGNVITTGTFCNTSFYTGGDFDPGPGTSYLTNPTAFNIIFVSKLDSNGNFIWAKQMSDPGQGYTSSDPVVDQAGSIYTTGYFWGTADFDPGPGSFNLTAINSSSYPNAFVSKLDSRGNFVWAGQLGAGGAADGLGIALDSADNIFTTGGGTGDFDPGPGTYLLTSYDGFVLKLTTVANLIVTSSPSGTTAGNAFTFDVIVKDPAGNTVTGYLGTVHFASSDAQAVLPADYAFTALDAGNITFSAILKTAGSQSLTVTEVVSASAATGSASVTVNAAAASTLVLTDYPSPTTAGIAHDFTVSARDVFGNIATGYTGTITFSSTDSQSVLPANYTFTSTDAGVHTFSATLKTVGSQSITATDTVTSTMKASQTGITVNPAAASQFVVSDYPSTTTAGVPHSFTVTALDAFGNLATGYTGTVAFTSSDGQAVLPANYTFTGTDAGVHTFSAILKTPGSQSITATDRLTGTVTGTSPAVMVVPAGVVASSFTLTGYPSPVTAGTAHNFTITVTDVNGYTVIGYTGTVTFSSSDVKAVLPANYTFTTTDYGVHTFSAILRRAGDQSITATDTVTGSITGSQSITVNPAATDHLVVSRFPSKTTAGVAQSFRVTAQDRYGNTTPAFADTVSFSSSDGYALLPGSYTFTTGDGGIHNFAATLITAGSQSITVQDMINSGIASGTQSGIVVNPAVASHLQVAGFPPSVLTGSAHNFTVTALDTYGNIATGYRGTANFGSNNGQANLPANYAFTSGDAGVHTFSATLNTVGTDQWISATDTANVGITGIQSGISVVPVQPTASVTGPPLNLSGSAGIPSQALTFILGASESGLPTGTVYSYSVQWGDGSAGTFSGPSGTQAAHVYAAAGTYTVGVTATDPGGHASLPVSTSVSITAVALETDPVNPNLTALYVGGTTGNDTIAITPVAGGGVKVGMNYVNYGSFFPTGHVIVYSQTGNDIIKTAAQTLGGVLTYVNVPLLIFAGNGNDVLNVSGSSANNILVGGAGTDRLIGGQGRDILIGGSGTSTLQAGSGGDILSGGTTAYDNNAAALAAVLAEWSRTVDYATRIADLTGTMSGGLNGAYLLNSSTVNGDGLVNKLYGGAGTDWYFAGVADVLFNRTSDEWVTPV